MAHLSGDEIRRLAREIVRDTPGGIRYTPLVRRIHADHPETPINTIHGGVWDLHRQFANEIAKPSRGVYVWIPATAAATPGEPAPASPTPVAGPREQDFYEPFKDYLKDDLEEATRAVVLGGAGLGEKWGTPDVIGVYKARFRHRQVRGRDHLGRSQIESGRTGDGFRTGGRVPAVFAQVLPCHDSCGFRERCESV